MSNKRTLFPLSTDEERGWRQPRQRTVQAPPLPCSWDGQTKALCQRGLGRETNWAAEFVRPWVAHGLLDSQFTHLQDRDDVRLAT